MEKSETAEDALNEYNRKLEEERVSKITTKGAPVELFDNICEEFGTVDSKINTRILALIRATGKTKFSLVIGDSSKICASFHINNGLISYTTSIGYYNNNTFAYSRMMKEFTENPTSYSYIIKSGPMIGWKIYVKLEEQWFITGFFFYPNFKIVLEKQ